MKNIRFTFFLTLIICFACVARAEAQLAIGMSFKDGINAAKKFATDSLGSDAVLVAGGTIGGQEFSGITLEFDDKSGKATMWAYVYYSKTKNQSLPVLVALGGLLVQVLPVPLPLPDGLLSPLDVALPYIGSDKAVAQMKNDTAYVRFKKEIPDKKPDFVFVADGAVQQDSVPNGVVFDFNQPIWSVSYTGGGDSSLNCIIGGKDGKVFCGRVAAPILGVSVEAANTVSEFFVTPTPIQSNGNIKFVLKDASIRSGEVILYDTRGYAVYRANAEQGNNNIYSLELKANGLNNGVYFAKFKTEKGTFPLGKMIINK